jgi:hypothetical protein
MHVEKAKKRMEDRLFARQFKERVRPPPTPLYKVLQHNYERMEQTHQKKKQLILTQIKRMSRPIDYQQLQEFSNKQDIIQQELKKKRDLARAQKEQEDYLKKNQLQHYQSQYYIKA